MSNDANDLIDFISDVSGEKHLRVEENFGQGFVRLRVSEAERRQAQHDIRSSEDILIEMLRNARDAGAAHIFIASTKADNIRTITLLDDGSGIPLTLQDKIFEPRVTSKLESIHQDRWGIHGRGMALYSISENTLHHAVCASAPEKGSSIQVIIDTNSLDERKDQSSWPRFSKDDEGNKSFVGPHNLIRTACEFVSDCSGRVKVYLGSATEIAATLYSLAQNNLTTQQLLFVDSASELKVVERLALAADAQDFIEIAKKIGLELSERSAHRILASEIPAIDDVLTYLKKLGKHRNGQDVFRDQRGLKIDSNDLTDFSRSMKRIFKTLEDKYYLSLNEMPKVRVYKDKITVTFDIIHKD